MEYEFHDALPLVAKGLHDLRISLGVSKLQALHSDKQASGSYCFFNGARRLLA